MSAEMKVIIAAGALLFIVFALLLKKKLPKRIKTSHYVKKWRQIQLLCSNKDDWCHAIIHADMLLDEVLKKRKITGKTTGERMVNAQSRFSANDAIWHAHKLANSLRQDGARTLSETEVKDVLIAFRQALRDLEALA